MELIDRDALTVELNNPTIYYLDDEGKYWLSPESAQSIIDDAPAVDAVPVVRCKDCKYYKYESVFVEMLCRGHFKCCEVYPDDFCSYGERKEQD